jgi:hypothetical protein
MISPATHTANIGWGADSFQVLAPATFLTFLAPPPVPEQLQAFEREVVSAARGWAREVLYTVLDPADPASQTEVNAMLTWMDAGITPAGVYAVVGGFWEDNGRQLDWCSPDAIPFALHLLKHRLRQVAHIGVWAVGQLHLNAGKPLTAPNPAFDRNTVNAIEALRSWDITHLAVWRDAIQTRGWLPAKAIGDVCRYFTTRVTV